MNNYYRQAEKLCSFLDEKMLGLIQQTLETLADKNHEISVKNKEIVIQLMQALQVKEIIKITPKRKEVILSILKYYIS